MTVVPVSEIPLSGISTNCANTSTRIPVSSIGTNSSVKYSYRTLKKCADIMTLIRVLGLVPILRLIPLLIQVKYLWIPRHKYQEQVSGTFACTRKYMLISLPGIDTNSDALVSKVPTYTTTP